MANEDAKKFGTGPSFFVSDGVVTGNFASPVLGMDILKKLGADVVVLAPELGLGVVVWKLKRGFVAGAAVSLAEDGTLNEKDGMDGLIEGVEDVAGSGANPPRRLRSELLLAPSPLLASLVSTSFSCCCFSGLSEGAGRALRLLLDADNGCDPFPQDGVDEPEKVKPCGKRFDGNLILSSSSDPGKSSSSSSSSSSSRAILPDLPCVRCVFSAP